MVNDIPLQLQFAVEDAVKNDTRLRFRFVYSHTKGTPTDKEASGKHYCVPLGFGWSKHAWGHPGPEGELTRVMFYKTYQGASYKLGMIAVNMLAVAETIPSHTPGKKSIQLWKASWYNNV